MNPGLWLTVCSIVGGTTGLLLGGYMSDLAKRTMGIRARFWVLSASQLLSVPFAFGMLLLPPPWSFVMLLLYYCLGEAKTCFINLGTLWYIGIQLNLCFSRNVVGYFVHYFD